jgi:hypothetical protein
MTDLHEQLRSLVLQHGTGIADNAEQFRAALDDFLTEDDASQGELNLLVDAVRLGAVPRLLTMIDNGADAEAAVREAGGGLARDRSSDEQRARWAVAAMGYALGRVGGAVVRQQLDGDVTRLPYDATAPAAPRPPVQSPPHQPPVQSPPGPPYQSPVQSPAHQQPAWPSGQPSHPSPMPAYGAPQPPRKSRRGLVAGLIALAVVVIGGGIALALVLGNGDSDGDDDNDSGGGGTTEACSENCIEGDGYSYALPEGWNDITDQVLEDNPEGGTLDTASAWGDSVAAGRANVIVEVNSWVYEDLTEAKEQLSNNLSNLGGEITDLDNRTIAGEDAEGVLLARSNDAGVDVEQRAYILHIDDNAVVITATHQAGDDAPLDQYEKIYDSWAWE